MSELDTPVRSRPLEITAGDIAAYRRDGAVVIRGVLTADEQALLVRGVEEVHARPGGMSSRVEGRDGRGATLVDQLPRLGSPTIEAFLATGTPARIAATMMETPSAHFVLDQLFYKEAGRVLPTPWHQDTPFLRVRGDDMARVWFTCDPSPRDLTVQLVRGSHRWNVVYDTATMAQSEVRTASEAGEFTYEGIGDESRPMAPDIERWRDSFDILEFDVEPGDALVFNGNMLHGARGREHHPLARRAYASMWGGPQLRHHRPKGNAMPCFADLHGVEVPHGAAIGDWPQAFPVGWVETLSVTDNPVFTGPARVATG